MSTLAMLCSAMTEKSHNNNDVIIAEISNNYISHKLYISHFYTEKITKWEDFITYTI